MESHHVSQSGSRRVNRRVALAVLAFGAQTLVPVTAGVKAGGDERRLKHPYGIAPRDPPRLKRAQAT
jgi:hypothetical protein